MFDGRIARTLSTDTIETLMVRANPGLTTAGVAVACEDGKLSEIRICMTKSLDFRACAETDRKGCRMRNLSIPAIP